MHPTSLPNRMGIGDLGPAAYNFVDFLHASGQRIWQVLPLGPTGYGDSPYQLFSAFAGNPLLIGLDNLVQENLLDAADLESTPSFPESEVDFGAVIAWKLPLLTRAFARFAQNPSPEFDTFCKASSSWLPDYALFTAVKHHFGVEKLWSQWPAHIRSRQPAAIETCARDLRDTIQCIEFQQFVFFSQWAALQKYGHDRGIRIMGDIPIYVAHDSADVWANPDLFQLDGDGNPAAVAGVPPDYFSATGQLWGNPIYQWQHMADTGFRWWIERFRASFKTFDLVRLDHFRGFEAYWEVPAGEATAQNGRWVKGPGSGLFEAVEKELGPLAIIAENLGVITPEVESIRAQFGYPGMAVLQFAFGADPQAPDFKPHNYTRQLAAYTGTHDNDTAMGWWESRGIGDSTRTQEEVAREKNHARRYLDTDGREMNWTLIRALLASVADIAVFPMQDLLGLGSQARMNTPGVPGGNWRWRMQPGQLRPELAARLRDLIMLYDRH